MFSFDTVPVGRPEPRKTLKRHVSDSPLNYAMAKDWSKPFAERVRTARSNARSWDEAHLATMEAIIRRLVRRGWVRRRTSVGKTGRATSRYLYPMNDRKYQIRISDHTQNAYRGQRGTGAEYLITDEIIRTETVEGIIARIISDWRKAER